MLLTFFVEDVIMQFESANMFILVLHILTLLCSIFLSVFYMIFMENWFCLKQKLWPEP